MMRCCLVVLLFAGGMPLFAQQPPPVKKLVAQLKSKKQEKRTEALMDLADHGPKAASAIPDLAKILPGVDDEERILAALALAKIGKASLPAVEKLLAHEDETTRFYALWTLGMLGKDAKALAPRVLGIFEKDADEEVQLKAAYALARIAPDSKEVLAAFVAIALKEVDFSPKRMAILEELRHFGPAAIQPLAKAGDELLLTPQIPESLAHILREHKTDAVADAMLPHVRLILPHSNFLLGTQQPLDDGFAWLLAKHGEKLLPGFERDLKGKEAADAVFVLGNIARILSTRGENPEFVKRAATLLAPTLKHADPAVRRSAATWTPMIEPVIDDIEKLLLDNDAAVRRLAWFNFQQAGHDPEPKLAKQFKAAKGDEKTRIACALLLVKPTEELHAFLWNALRDKKCTIRLQIASTLAENNRGPDTNGDFEKILVPVFLDALKSERLDERVAAADGLARLPLFVKSHVPAILARLDDPSPEVKAGLLASLQIHADADRKEALKRIVPLLADENEEVRGTALLAMFALDKDALPHLIARADKETSPRVWSLLCQKLGDLGKAAEPAIPSLVRASDDPHRDGTAIATLFKIAPGKAYAALVSAWMKKDEKLRADLKVAAAIAENDMKLLEQLQRDWRDNQQRVARALTKLLPIMPAQTQGKAVLAFMPLLSGQATDLSKSLKGKDVAQRKDAVARLAESMKLWYALSPALNHLPYDKYPGVFNDHHDIGNRLEALFTKARTDPDLQVRRLARTLHNGLAPQVASNLGLLGVFPFQGPFGPFRQYLHAIP